MRVNQHTLLLGKKVVLVPYTSRHVPRYHEWMKSEELRRLTASEPLTLEQEYAMQRSWRDDADKCTFIVLDAEKWQAQPCPSEENCMMGDVNLFLTDPGDPTLGEIEVMIAEPSCRGRGCGTEAVLMMLAYGKSLAPPTPTPDPGVGISLFGPKWGFRRCSFIPLPFFFLVGMSKLGLTTFEAKIGQENEQSMGLFRKLHFEQVALSTVFQEVTLRLRIGESERQWLLEQTCHMQEQPYREGSPGPH
ncbi:alpha/beta-tubulin-N-acetyltransferase 9 isoform X1 [Suncus etruscus]|uniref:alpha/beta-tubulin-N-acetyltransferase 9 isoform X1 n=1 Tax=Suncus etruscus TaxID=109475 RepID=UPI00211059E3|nr:alpha/beta-tubulin-N-acetyltransferase 9 isoform X1 [Suncus etruscus]